MSALISGAFLYAFNGTGADKIRSASAANMDPAANAPSGVQLMARIGDWSVTHNPGDNMQASATKAAVAGARHVCTSLAFTVSSGGALAGTTAYLRDGASGVGTILWEGNMLLPAGEGRQMLLAGLNLVGSVNTAMTIEFGAALGASTFEAVAMTGYTIG